MPARTSRTDRPRSRPAVLAGAGAAIATLVLTAPTAAMAQIGEGVGEPVGGGGSGAGKAAAETSSGAPVALLVGIAVVGLIVVAVLVAAIAISRGRRPGPAAAGAAAPVSAAATPGADPAELARLTDERGRLVQVLVELDDQLDSIALRAWVTQALAEVGVARLAPDGERFDPTRHQAVDQVATADPSADGTVTQTVRAGYVDRGVLLRLPQVVVARAGAPS